MLFRNMIKLQPMIKSTGFRFRSFILDGEEQQSEASLTEMRKGTEVINSRMNLKDMICWNTLPLYSRIISKIVSPKQMNAIAT